MALRNRKFLAELISFFGVALLEAASADSSVYRRSIHVDAGNFVLRAIKTPRTQLISPAAALATGIAIAGNTQIKAAVTLSATVATAVTTFVAQPDVARTIRVKGNQAGLGDGTFALRVVLLEGLDQFGRAIKETVPLNAATAVDSKRAFSSLTRVTLPVRVGAGDTVSLGYGAALGLDRPCELAADLVEVARKATAATAYTSEALPGTTDITPVHSTLAATITAAAVSITLVDGSTFANGAQRVNAEILGPDNMIEEVIITSRTGNVLTVVRGVNGQTARRHVQGATLVTRPGNTIAPALTADDRLLVTYLTKAA